MRFANRKIASPALPRSARAPSAAHILLLPPPTMMGLALPLAAGACKRIDSGQVNARCSHGTFIDVGANRGDTLAAFYASSAVGGLFSPVLRLSGSTQTPWSFCTYSFEANPMWTATLLESAQAALPNVSAHGGSLTVCTETAVTAGDAGPEVTLYVDPRLTAGSATIVREKMNIPKHARRDVVSTLDLPRWLANHTRAKAQRRFTGGMMTPVILKMDIEGAEYSIMRELVSSGFMCHNVDVLVVEWHRGKLNASLAVPLEVDTTLQWLLSTPSCKMRLFGIGLTCPGIGKVDAAAAAAGKGNRCGRRGTETLVPLDD